MKFKKIAKEGAREEWEDLKAHWTASRKPKMHDQFEYNREWNKAHPEITCDRCGFTSRYEDYFGIEGDQILCDKCRRGMNEARKPTKKAQKKEEQWWFGIPGAKFIYHGDWSDPEIQYKGFSINYWDVTDGLYNTWKEENPDKDEKEFDKWM